MEQGKNKLDWIPWILEDVILKQPKCLLFVEQNAFHSPCLNPNPNLELITNWLWPAFHGQGSARKSKMASPPLTKMLNYPSGTKPSLSWLL